LSNRHPAPRVGLGLEAVAFQSPTRLPIPAPFGGQGKPNLIDFFLAESCPENDGRRNVLVTFVHGADCNKRTGTIGVHPADGISVAEILQ
jgi:hypothetical protein